MNIKENAKINKIGISVSSDRPYFEIQFHDVTFERVYLMIRNNSMISRVFVVNDDDNKLIKLSLDDFGLLYWIDCSTCDIAYDIRTFDENVVYYARDIFLIVNDKDYNYIAERATFDDEEEIEMPEFVNTEDFTTPIESLKADLEFIQTFYDVDRIKDRDNAELLIDSYKRAIELLTNAEVK